MADSKMILAVLLVMIIVVVVAVNLVFISPALLKIAGTLGTVISWFLVLIIIIFVTLMFIKAM